MRFKKTVITAGFAMFSMFFGSGNLVFPLTIGTQALDNYPSAMLGLLLTGVLVPFLGLIGVILYSGNRANYFSCIGKTPAFLLTFLMLSIMGPIGVMPRCITVAHGGVNLFLPDLPLWIFSLVFCVITVLLVWNHNKVVPIIGRILTPALLAGITAIIVAGIFFSNNIPEEANIDALSVFFNSLLEGYQTMDLLAAFFFSATTVAYLRAHLRSDDRPNTLLKLSLASSLIGASLIGAIYMAFVMLGAKFASQLETVAPEKMLAAIAGYTMGPLAIPVVATTVALACLTTATILVMLFADFLNNDISRKKIGAHKSVIITTAICFMVSLVGFSSLKVWLFTILQVVYPALIALTVFNILYKLFGFHYSKYAFWITAIGSTCYYVLGG